MIRYFVSISLIIVCFNSIFARNLYPEIQLYRQILQKEEINGSYQEALEDYSASSNNLSTDGQNSPLYHEYLLLMELPQNNEEELLLKINSFNTFAIKSGNMGDISMEILALYQTFCLAFWSTPQHYSKAFQLALILEEKLLSINEEVYPSKRLAYFKLGEAYYLFKDFDKSIELLEKALTNQAPLSFVDTASLKAKLTIGICYANIGQMDISDKYFLSVLESADLVINRPVFNATALAYLGCNSMLIGNYEKALALNKEVLAYLKTTNNYGQIAGMYACACFSNFGLDELEKAGEMADSVLVYAHKDNYNPNKRLKQAFDILLRYNMLKGNSQQALNYKDSLIQIYKEEELLYSSRYILGAHEEFTERKLRKQKELTERNQYIAITTLIVLFITILSLIIIIFYYRRRQIAYQSLVTVNDRWAQSDTFSHKVPDQNNLLLSTEEDLLIADKLNKFMLKKKAYNNPSLSLGSLAELTGIRQHKLSEIINRCYNKNFNQYLNEFRVREAIRLMADKDYKIERIMMESGFSSRSSFYKIFKETTGLTPSEYRKTK